MEVLLRLPNRPTIANTKESATMLKSETQRIFNWLFWKMAFNPSWEQSRRVLLTVGRRVLDLNVSMGFGAEASHWEPPVYDQTTPIEPHLKNLLSSDEDLADQAILWIEREGFSSDNPSFAILHQLRFMHSSCFRRMDQPFSRSV